MAIDKNAVKRWVYCPRRGMNQHPRGAYIEFPDHEKVLGRVRIMWAHHLEERDNEIDRLRSILAEARAEAAVLQKNSERYEWLKKQTAYRFGKIQSACVIDAVDVLYFKSDEFDAQIDAEMEKKA